MVFLALAAVGAAEAVGHLVQTILIVLTSVRAMAAVIVVVVVPAATDRAAGAGVLANVLLAAKTCPAALVGAVGSIFH
jgi:hypothetical protein